MQLFVHQIPAFWKRLGTNMSQRARLWLCKPWKSSNSAFLETRTTYLPSMGV